MDVRAVVGDIATQEVDAVVVNLFQGVQSPGGGTGAVDKALDGAISGLIADGEIKGKKGELTLIHSLGKITPKRVLVVGLGKQSSLNLETVANVAAESARYLRKIGVKRAASIVHGAGTGGLDAGAAAQAMTEGALLGLYTFKQLKSSSSDDEAGPQELLLVEQESDKLSALEEGVRVGSILAEAASLARTLGNEPANRLTPTRLGGDRWRRGPGRRPGDHGLRRGPVSRDGDERLPGRRPREQRAPRNSSSSTTRATRTTRRTTWASSARASPSTPAASP